MIGASDPSDPRSHLTRTPPPPLHPPRRVTPESRRQTRPIPVTMPSCPTNCRRPFVRRHPTPDLSTPTCRNPVTRLMTSAARLRRSSRHEILAASRPMRRFYSTAPICRCGGVETGPLSGGYARTRSRSCPARAQFAQCVLFRRRAASCRVASTCHTDGFRAAPRQQWHLPDGSLRGAGARLL